MNRNFSAVVPVILFSLTLVCVTAASGQSFEVAPGPVSAFEIVVPRSGQAGVELPLRIVARDASGNVVTDFAESRSEVSLRLVTSELSGAPLDIEPARFSSADFRGGVLESRVIIKSAVEGSIEVSHRGGSATGSSSRIDIDAGPVADIRVSVPLDVRVGVPFEASIEVFDRFGNIIDDFNRRGGELLIEAGVSGAKGRFEPDRLSPSHFTGGRAVAKFRYSRAEQTSLAVRSGEIVGRSSSLVARAGKLSSVRVTLPQTAAIAGEPFTVILEARDENGSIIANFDRVGEVLSLSSSGLGEVSPTLISPAKFRDGIATIEVTYRVAENLKVSVADKNGIKRGESDGTVKVKGGRLGKIEIVAAERARAGEPLAVQLMAYDNFGNIIRDFSHSKLSLRLGAADASPLEAPVVTGRDFVAGTAFLLVKPYKAGPVSLVVVDEITGTTGRSQLINVAAGDVASFAVKSSPQVIAREPFVVEITALDRFGNIVRDYSRSGSGLVVEAPLSSGLTPASVPPAAFLDGTARVSFSYNTAEQISLSFVEQGGTARGVSDFIFVTHAEAKNFRIDAENRATAGVPFKLRITALDDFGNPALSYGRKNGQIALYTENGSPMAPPYFSRTAFANGEAEVDIVFLASGNVRVRADAMSATGSVGGVSSGIRVDPGAPSRLTLSAPEEVLAGEPFRLRIEMSDRLGNRIYGYSPRAASLSVKVIRDGRVAASSAGLELEDIKNMVFRDGVAELTLRTVKSDEIAIELRDELLGVSGRSLPIKVVSASVSSFKVESLSPSALRAGELMKLRAVAIDEFGNVVTGFGGDGSAARLSARLRSSSNDGVDLGVIAAGDVLLPASLSGRLFRNGVANFYALYGRAERIDIIAERLPAGAITRSEVAAVAAEERGESSRISILCNAPVEVDSIRTLTESLIELRIPGAVLSSFAPSVTKRAGLVSMVSLSQTDHGVRVLLHIAAPASMRTSVDANRVVIDVDPVVGRPAPLPMLESMNVPEVSGGVVRSQESSPGASLWEQPKGEVNIAEVNSLVKDARYPDALNLVVEMLKAKPDDAALLGIKRRLEVLIGIGSTSVSPAASSPASSTSVPITPRVPTISPAIPALQNGPKPIEMEPNMASIEAAIRAGSYGDAKSLLDRFINANPSDERAKKMRNRVEQLMKLMQTGQDQ